MNLRNFGQVRAFVAERFSAAENECAEVYLLDDAGNLLALARRWTVPTGRKSF